MKREVSRAFLIALGTAAFAVMTEQGLGAAQSQTPGSTPPAAGGPQTPGTSQVPTAAPTPTQTPGATARSSANQQMTISGCIQSEADYRRATSAGRGGAVGTGVGVGNEFVLANATMGASGSTSPAGTSGAGAPSATGTAGAAAATAYELTGPREGDAAALVGKRVEIIGMVKTSTSATPGGPTANVPLSQDLQLSEIEVASIKETSGACPTATNR